MNRFEYWHDEEILAFEYFFGTHKDYFARYSNLGNEYFIMHHLYEDLKEIKSVMEERNKVLKQFQDSIDAEKEKCPKQP